MAATSSTSSSMTSTASPTTPALKRPKPMAPQDAIDDFWSKYTSKTPGKGMG